MLALGGVTIVQKFTRGYPCRIFAREARKNTTLLPLVKILYDGDVPQMQTFLAILGTLP